MYKVIPLAIALAAVPAIVQAQTSDPVIEISANHGHTFTLENSQAKIIKAWPGAFEAFDFGEHPNIPNAKFIFVKLKPGAKLDSTTLTLIINEGGKEITKSYILKRIKGIPHQTTTLIGNQPVVAARPEPATQVITAQVHNTPSSARPPRQVHKEEKTTRKPTQLKVAKEFNGAFASGGSSKTVVSAQKTKEIDQPKPESEETKETEIADQGEAGSTVKPKRSPAQPLPLIQASKTIAAKAKVEQDKPLIERSSLNNYAVANHLLKGLYRAENLKQISSNKAQFWQAQSTARLLRRGYNIQQSLRRTGLAPVTFDNLLKHGGVGQ
jgi:hypothetical protein